MKIKYYSPKNCVEGWMQLLDTGTIEIIQGQFMTAFRLNSKELRVLANTLKEVADELDKRQ